MSDVTGIPMAIRNVNATMHARCDICGRLRGGTKPISHEKCSKIRAAKFKEAEKNA